MADQAAAFVGEIPRFYDSGLGPVIFAGFAEDMARRAAAGGPARVLETAAGTGIVTRRLRDLLPAGARLVATDLNAGMLKVAETKFRPGEVVAFEPADAQALPFADGSFDTVVCQFGIMFYPDRDKSYRETLRVLAPGGRYLFSVWDSHARNAFGRIAHEVSAAFYPSDPPGFYRVPFSCSAIDPIKEALQAAGFRGISAAVLERAQPLGDVRAFAHALVFGNPLLDQIRARGGVTPERVVDAIEAALRREFGPDPATMPIQCILFEARRP